MSLDSGPRVLIFDSGLGGLTVFAPVAEARPDVELCYVADDAFFPYGALSERALVDRVVGLMGELVARWRPDLVVIACNTASTLVLAPLREKFADLPFVGTVPAIKPAAQASRSKLISVLATPGTVARDYTRGLIREFAGDCDVTLVGAARLAGIAERFLRGEPASQDEIAEEIAPVFVARGDQRTDQIVLACTHFPLLLPQLDGRRAVGGRVRRSCASDRAPRRRAARAGAVANARGGAAGDVHERGAGVGGVAKNLA